ncbi:hypothetical protein Fmac_019406 [Flemingia macrophylla]|uniref:Late embryogenesis abundant protein LEA-2 subgroup domain-containing protein n=1 Tax=Flemingia macrophylla TaxID=520843 RepID=A0ABD1M7W0_9FABA
MASRVLKTCVATFVVVLIIVIVVLVTLSVTVLKPKNPNISVYPVGLEHFDYSIISNASIKSTVSLGMIVNLKNPNYGSFEHKSFVSYVKFHDTVVAEVPMEAQTIPPRSQMNVTTHLDLMVGKLVHDPNFFSDVVSGDLNFTSAFSLKGKASVLKIFKLKSQIRNSCNITLNIWSQKSNSTCVTSMKL